MQTQMYATCRENFLPFLIFLIRLVADHTQTSTSRHASLISRRLLPSGSGGQSNLISRFSPGAEPRMESVNLFKRNQNKERLQTTGRFHRNLNFTSGIKTNSRTLDEIKLGIQLGIQVRI